MKKKINVLTLNEGNIYFIYFFISFIILLSLIVLEVSSWELMIERAKVVFSFWILLFLIIFLPRRILKKSKKFRYFILYLRRNYLFLFKIRLNINMYGYVYFCFIYTRFYLMRVLKYILVGTKVKWLKPYRKNWERNELIVEIIRQLVIAIQYMMLYIFKIIYEVIRFFDNASLYKIIRSRIMGFMFMSTGYIIIGVNFFMYYISSLILGFICWNVIKIFFWYKKNTKEKPSENFINNLYSALALAGLDFQERHLKNEIVTLWHKTLLNESVLKLKRLTSYTRNDFYKRYGGKQTTKYMLSIFDLIEVEKESMIYVEFFKKEFPYVNDIKTIKISKYSFITKFLIKKNWYEDNNEYEGLNRCKEDNFTNSYFLFLNDFVNEFHFKVWFLNYLISGPESDENDNLVEEDWWVKFDFVQDYCYKDLKNYFEFHDLVKFVLLVEKIIVNNGGSNEFYKKIYLKNNLVKILKNIYMLRFKGKVTPKMCECSVYIIGSYVYSNILNLDIKNYKKDINELEEYFKNELMFLKSLQFDKDIDINKIYNDIKK
jgi:hypothetical protein